MFATEEDVRNRVGRPLTTAEAESLNLLLAGAQSVVETYVGLTEAQFEELEKDVPPIIKLATASICARALANPIGLSSRTETLGAYSETVQFGRDLASELTLTHGEEIALRRAVWGTTSGSSQQTPDLLEDIATASVEETPFDD